MTLTLLRRIRMVAAAAALFAALPVCAAVEWRGLDKDNWCSGPVLTPEKLKGKVVLVDRWGVHCPPCRRSLPHIEALWKKFRNKPFVVIGSHCQNCQGSERERIGELVKENGLTYSIYLNARPANEPRFSGIPFYYLVNPQGEIVYQGLGFSDAKAKELEDAVATATPRNALEAKKLEESKKAAISAAAPFAQSKFPGVAEEIAELLAE